MSNDGTICSAAGKPCKHSRNDDATPMEKDSPSPQRASGKEALTPQPTKEHADDP